MKANGAIARLSEKLGASTKGNAPKISSFMEFLTTQAKVKTPGGEYVNYSLEGREALIPIVETFDLVLGSHTGKPLPDATIDICGGAQFGKTILALNFGIYLTACHFRNWGYYLPDDDLVEGIVDAKLRPDVIEQIDWLGPLMSVGKMDDKRGRSVNRKGAFQVSDGKRKAQGMIRGMGKIPTSFSMDAVMEDEKDDIPAKRSKYLTGRMTASDLRLRSSIGTQRMHAAGQQKQWEDGSQGVYLFQLANDKQINLEENWPQVCRLAVDGDPRPTDPKLTTAGEFRDDQGNAWAYEPGANYYFACPDTGEVIDRSRPILKHLKPERIKLRKWSFRISQFCIAAMPINQFVSRWQDAIKDPEMMTVFRCDVMALPSNTEQAINPEVILRARTVEEPFDLSLASADAPRFAGLDTGNRCWFVSRDVFGEDRKRINWAEQIPLSQMVARAEVLFHKLGIQCLANITDEGLRAALAQVRGDLESTTEIHQAMAVGVEETVRGHLLSLNSRSPRTGFYGKAARSVESKWSAAEGLVTVPHRGVALRYYGGRVTMKDRLLALPTDAVPTRGDERMRPGEMQDLAYIPSRKRGGGTRGFLFEGEARPGSNGNNRIRRKNGGRLMYVLREWTDHKADPTVMPDTATLTASASSAAEDYLAAILQKGGLS